MVCGSARGDTREVRNSYMLKSVAYHKGKSKVYHSYWEGLVSLPLPSRVIFTSFLDETDDRFAVMTAVDTKELFMWRNVDKKWSKINTRICELDCFQDIICHNKKFYVMLTKAGFLTVDFQSLEVNLVAGPREDLKNAILFLVESLNDLFLVAQFSSEGIHCFKVFKLNEETHEWDLVEDELELEDRVFFDVECNPFSVSASEFPALRGNCIYFFNYDFREYEDLDIEDVRIYDLRTHTDSKLADFRGFSTLFWPPPAWLKQRSFRSAGLLRN
ncbi:F-box protein At2g17036-like isoform X3 [Pistacia vera]|uniref:F-box protein At2g17036-like isoform X3 n=1 Tax=Pistacia vera TaxID=55513 RepID=UPI001262F0E4|nr:F-box protein At2g17036-like isoform X3 [Pistacia vera]